MSLINMSGLSVEAIVKACCETEEIAADFTTVSLSGFGGSIRSNIDGTQRTITTTLGAYKARNISFKDIAIVNGVVTTTGKNLGNNATVGSTLIFVKKYGLDPYRIKIRRKRMDDQREYSGTISIAGFVDIDFSTVYPIYNFITVENTGTVDMLVQPDLNTSKQFTVHGGEERYFGIIGQKIRLINTTSSSTMTYRVNVEYNKSAVPIP